MSKQRELALMHAQTNQAHLPCVHFSVTNAIMYANALPKAQRTRASPRNIVRHYHSPMPQKGSITHSTIRAHPSTATRTRCALHALNPDMHSAASHHAKPQCSKTMHHHAATQLCALSHCTNALQSTSMCQCTYHA